MVSIKGQNNVNLRLIQGYVIDGLSLSESKYDENDSILLFELSGPELGNDSKLEIICWAKDTSGKVLCKTTDSIYDFSGLEPVQIDLDGCAKNLIAELNITLKRDR